ncbi:MAG: zonular occludens toxin domain-containing protein [Planctomycetaceae bacterium]|jgi:hypothetical protein|nr:zonular occludens toxin domain-containing protein [Planctomycetaceae bacterium]
MSLRLIHGKPGSGKSCFCVDMLSKMLIDWADYRIKNNEVYPRRLLTNIPLDIQAINEYISKIVGQDIDLSDQIKLLSDRFFFTPKQSKEGKKEQIESGFVAWWEKFRRGDFIVIDEVHHYLSVNVKRRKGGLNLSESFTNYISMHRHRQHDLIFLSQHIDNVAPEVKKMVEVVFEVLNVKSMVIGKFPFTIPMADIDVVRESWGYPVQLAHIRRGVCEARKVVYDKAHEVFILNSKLFSLYKSHTLSKESLDRPSFKMSRFRSIVWFLSRHIVRLGFWFVILITLLFCLISFFKNFPSILVNSLVMSVPVSSDDQSSKKVVVSAVAVVPDASEKIVEVTEKDEKKVDVIIIGFIDRGVITNEGIKYVGDIIFYKGKEETIKFVDFRRGYVEFLSGVVFRK